MSRILFSFGQAASPAKRRPTLPSKRWPPKWMPSKSRRPPPNQKNQGQVSARGGCQTPGPWGKRRRRGKGPPGLDRAGEFLIFADKERSHHEVNGLTTKCQATAKSMISHRPTQTHADTRRHTQMFARATCPNKRGDPPGGKCKRKTTCLRAPY